MTRRSIDVMVPTWRRPDDLDRCLRGLSGQTEPPREILVVWRRGDDDVHAVASRWSAILPLRLVETFRPGVVAAMNRGLESATSQVLAITDDDAFPHPDWCARLLDVYASDPSVVAVGGRDLVHDRGGIVAAKDAPVGTISSFGRVRGNHHVGSGPSRSVSFLKGVNCSFRRDAARGLAFDERLRGAGAQVHWELAFFLKLGRRGRIVYDPSILVDHFPSIRHDADKRDGFSPVAARDAAFNETLAIIEHLPWTGRAAFAAWAALVGTTAHPGIAQGLRDALGRRRTHALRRVASTLLGRADACLSPSTRWKPATERLPA